MNSASLASLDTRDDNFPNAASGTKLFPITPFRVFTESFASPQLCAVGAFETTIPLSKHCATVLHSP